MQVENCPLSKRSSLAALCSNPATRVADQVAILFASGAHAGFDQLAEAAARLRTQFPSLQHVVGTAVRTSLLQWLMVRPAYALLTEEAAQLQTLFLLLQRIRGDMVRAWRPCCPQTVSCVVSGCAHIAAQASLATPSLQNVWAALTYVMCRGLTAGAPGT